MHAIKKKGWGKKKGREKTPFGYVQLLWATWLDDGRNSVKAQTGTCVRLNLPFRTLLSHISTRLSKRATLRKHIFERQRWMAQLSPALRVHKFKTGRRTLIQHPRLRETLYFSTWGCQFGRTDSRRENAGTGLAELQECCRLDPSLLLWSSLSCSGGSLSCSGGSLSCSGVPSPSLGLPLLLRGFPLLLRGSLSCSGGSLSFFGAPSPAPGVPSPAQGFPLLLGGFPLLLRGFRAFGRFVSSCKLWQVLLWALFKVF